MAQITAHEKIQQAKSKHRRIDCFLETPRSSQSIDGLRLAKLPDDIEVFAIGIIGILAGLDPAREFFDQFFHSSVSQIASSSS